MACRSAVRESRMKVQFYATLRQIAGGKTAHVELAECATAGDLLRALERRYPAFTPLLWRADGTLSDYLKVFVNGREIRHLQMLDTPVPPTAEVDIFPPVAGGAAEG